MARPHDDQLDKHLNRREFTQLLTGAAVLPIAGLTAAKTGSGVAIEKLVQGPALPNSQVNLSQSLPAFEKSEDGTLHWAVGNSQFLQELCLQQGQLFCSSLMNRRSGHEWIHPTKRSVEFLIQIGNSKEQTVTLTGEGKWDYERHVIRENDQGWSELDIILRSKALPLRVTRHYFWNQELPLLRQFTQIHNEGPENLTLRRVDTFLLRVSPVPVPLELHWMNNFCRAMKPDPGNPIHYRSIDDNVDQAVSTGPYSPDCAWFGLWIGGQNEGLIGGWEWSGPMVVHFGDLLDPCLIHGGLDPQGMEEILQPGDSFAAPVGWYGFVDGNLDEAAVISHDLIRTALGPALPKENYPWIGYCSWSASLDEKSPFNEKGTHPWFPTQDNLLSQVMASADLGCELFLWDYGWFPQLGDWWCDPKRFPKGPGSVVEAVKKSGMKLGLWFGFGNADETSQVICNHPDWLATYGGKPIPDLFFTRTGASVWHTRIICLAHRPAREWVKQQLVRVIEEFELDWLKHDFDLITICQDQHHTHTPGDGRIADCEGFYEIMDFVRQRFPHVVCENWMNNSAVPDYGVLQRHHMQLIGDAYRAFSLRQMVYGHSQIFPIDRQHRYLRFEQSEGEFKTMLRSGSIGGPWTLLSDPRRLSIEQRNLLKAEIKLYKSIRHLFGGARVYRLIGRPHPKAWDAFELYDSSRGEGVIYVFRNQHPQPVRSIILKGLDNRQTYRLTCLDHQEERTLTGQQLTTVGLPVSLPLPDTSEVILLSRR